MPGVPSSRGCEACRKQKKKCDQLEPSCSRCTRLQIACIGCGQQRYKFKTTVSRSTRIQPAQGSVLTVCKVPSPIPSNEKTLIFSGFMSFLGVTDLRYDFTYYGGFLKDIPRRLGTNDALDASVSALASAFPSLYTQKKTPEMLERYIFALKTLRITLHDPVKAYTSNTLCAIYLMEICQSWIGRHDDRLTSHGEILAHLLNAAPVEDWRDSFEIELLITVCASVVIESFINRKIQLNVFFTKLFNTYGQPHGPRKPPQTNDDGPIETLSLRSIARIGEFLRYPKLHLMEMASFYRQLLVDCRKVRLRLDQLTELTLQLQNPLQSYPIVKQHTAYQAAYGMANTFALIIGSILRIFDPSDYALVEDSERISEDVMELAENASQYRPVGSGYMPVCLIAAWAATYGTPKQAKVENTLQDWQSDFKEVKWMKMAIWLKRTLDDLRSKLAISQLEISLVDFYDTTKDVHHAQGAKIEDMGAC